MRNLPEEFLKQLELLDHDAYRMLPDVIEKADPVVSVRINPSKKNSVSDILGGAQPVDWNSNGFYLDERPAFTLDPRLHQGAYYVQDASSMAIGAAVGRAVELIGDGRALRYLDACAAPGGKTTAAFDALPADTFVVANEYDARRAQILAENLAKWGVDAFVSREDASKPVFPDDFFDIIAADVPCSGEGMMRKDPFAIEQWTPALVAECAARQRDIVDALWSALRPGGYFIYSTCTFNLAENEKIISYIISELGGVPVEVPLAGNGIVGAQGGYDFPAYRFVPGNVRGEGLFMAMLRKPEGSASQQKFNAKSKPGKSPLPLKINEILDGNYTLVLSEPLRAVCTIHVPLYERLVKDIKPVVAGVEIGVMKGRDFIPSQQLALSRSLRRGYYPEAEVGVDVALSYLRRDVVSLPADVPRGIVLLTYGGLPLGFVKNLGSRANNLYPEAWRIRKV